MNFEKLVLNLPETAIELFAQYAGPKSFYVGQSFEITAENEATKVITRAMKLHFLKSMDSRKYPCVFKRHTTLLAAKYLGIDEVKEYIVQRQLVASRLRFGQSINRRYKNVLPNQVAVNYIYDRLMDGDNIAIPKIPRDVLIMSIRAALLKYKNFLESCSIEYLITHAPENLLLNSGSVDEDLPEYA